MTDQKSIALAEIDTLLNGENDYSIGRSAEYIHNFIKSTNPQSPVAYFFCQRAEDQFAKEKTINGFPKNKDYPLKKGDKAKYETNFLGDKKGIDEEDWVLLESYFEEQAKDNNVEKPQALKNLMLFAEYLGLDEDEKEVLELLYVYHSNNTFERLFSKSKFYEGRSLGAAIARLLGKPENYKKYGKILAAESRFKQYALLQENENFSGGIFPEISYDLLDSLDTLDFSKDTIVSRMIGRASESDLSLEDFEYIGEDLTHILTSIKTAIENGEKGINVLLYGPAGGGKTELAKVIADALGKTLYAVAEEKDGISKNHNIRDEDGDLIGHEKSKDTSGNARLSVLLRAQALLEGNKNAFLLFDEIEDLLKKGTDSEKAADVENKLALNRLLEDNPVVTIWGGNDLEKFHEAVRQRYFFSLYVGRPPVLVRQKIWQKQLKLQNVSLNEDEILELAREYDAAPRQIRMAIVNARLSKDGMKAIRTYMPSASKIAYGNRDTILSSNRVSTHFDKKLISTKEEGDKTEIKQLIARGKKRDPFALFAEGNRGSGIRSTLREMSEQMVMPPIEASMAQLMIPSPFSSPASNIASIFAVATDERGFLIINDIEALSPSPNSNSAWGEDTLVPFFLSLLYKHKLPVAVTSFNQDAAFPLHLTQAFSSTLSFTPLTERKKNQAFMQYFGQKAPAELKKIEDLLIGDFALVHKLLRNRDLNNMYAEDLLPLLVQQINIRSQTSSNEMGFGRKSSSTVIEFPTHEKRNEGQKPLAATLKFDS